MRASPSDTVRAGRQRSESIGSAAQQIALVSTDLSPPNAEQAASLGPTASGMCELTATMKQNADKTGQASTLVGGAAQVAHRGGHALERMVDTTHRIESGATGRIAQIVALIESIAFQTNILALSAAATARAG